jgi:diguanylate cyclase (GGDEF)-like protein
LRNRRAFEEELRQACAGAEGPFALLLCDLDGFKQVNDTLGHAAGDALLREIAFRLVVETKPHGIVARLGGDEFGILLQPSTQALAAATAQRLVEAVARPIRIGNEDAAVGVSIGIALGSRTPKAQLDAKALMAGADAAMYDAKRRRAGYGFAPAGGESAATPPSSASAPVVPLRRVG